MNDDTLTAIVEGVRDADTNVDRAAARVVERDLKAKLDAIVAEARR